MSSYGTSERQACRIEGFTIFGEHPEASFLSSVRSATNRFSLTFSSCSYGIDGTHNLRRTCAKLCRKDGGDLEKIKFLLGHSWIQTTARYLGSEQDIDIAVNDNL